jgi:hypothetical protein
VVERIEPAPVTGFSNSMAKKPLGKDVNPWDRPKGERVVIAVRSELTTWMRQGQRSPCSFEI